MKDTEDVQRLIRLKRYETPGEEYFENFAEQFKERQRSEMLHRSARSILAERVSLWFDEWNGSRWLVPTGAAAAAALAAGLYFSGDEAGMASPAGSGIAENTVQQSELPPFPESTDEIIRLQIPKPKVSSEVRPGPVLPANAYGRLREL